MKAAGYQENKMDMAPILNLMKTNNSKLSMVTGIWA